MFHYSVRLNFTKFRLHKQRTPFIWIVEGTQASCNRLPRDVCLIAIHYTRIFENLYWSTDSWRMLPFRETARERAFDDLLHCADFAS